jgi:hypothetical protein
VEKEYTKPSSYWIERAASLLLQGVGPGNVDNTVAERGGIGIDSTNNINSVNPTTTIYPRSSSTNPDYSVSDQQLRSAIHIPSTFKYGTDSKQAVILVPGTAIPAGTTYAHNFAKLLASTTFADPLWLNIPGFTLGDIQVSAEYVAYAIHYISGITGGKNVSIVTWSQGSLDTQWALKYWPSTRGLVSDHIAISGDYHGTTLAYALCPGFPGNLLLGGIYGHAGVLYNPLAWALAVDALQNPGPGHISRLDLPTVCGSAATPGLTVSDVVSTVGMTVIGAKNALEYYPRVTTEPDFKPYVT